MQTTQNFKESANSSAVRKLMMALAALVVLSVSGYGTVIYIQLMTSVFPSGPLQIACYMGAASNFLLMLVLLIGKFVWFRPGAHEVASWLVTVTELVVAILNMMLAFQVANHAQLSSFMAAWQYLAPVSPIFSMIGATALLMTSTEMRRRHKALEIEEEKEHSEQAFTLAMHRAQMDTKGKYLSFVTTGLTQELNAPERQQEMRGHASLLVTQILTEMSGLHSPAPQLRGPQYPNSQTVGASGPLPTLTNRATGLPVSPDESFIGSVSAFGDDADVWLAQVNQRLAQERARRASGGLSVQDEAQPHEDLSYETLEGGDSEKKK